MPINDGWFKPQKFVSSFIGKYARKSHLQTLTQSMLDFGLNGLEYSLERSRNQGQQSIITIFQKN